MARPTWLTTPLSSMTFPLYFSAAAFSSPLRSRKNLSAVSENAGSAFVRSSAAGRGRGGAGLSRVIASPAASRILVWGRAFFNSTTPSSLILVPVRFSSFRPDRSFKCPRPASVIGLPLRPSSWSPVKRPRCRSPGPVILQSRRGRPPMLPAAPGGGKGAVEGLPHPSPAGDGALRGKESAEAAGPAGPVEPGAGGHAAPSGEGLRHAPSPDRHTPARQTGRGRNVESPSAVRLLTSEAGEGIGDCHSRKRPGGKRHFGVFLASLSASWINFSKPASMAFSPGLPAHLWRITPSGSMT
jgi:hypothetical protein